MTPDEILEIDAQRNHPKGTQAGNLRAAINDFLSKRGHIVRQGNTLIMFRGGGDSNDVEYHCFNADSPQILAENVMKFFVMAKKLGYKTATTPYENPKINDLFKKIVARKYEVEIEEKDDGYEAKVRL